MMKRLALLLLFGMVLASSIDLELWNENSKVVNGIRAYEIGIKASAKLTKLIPIIYNNDLLTQILYGAYGGIGFSQGYTSQRDRFVPNHAGDRLDWSVGVLFGDKSGQFEVRYTHSCRRWYDGANPKDYFFYDDVDSLKFSYVTEFTF